MGAADHDGVKLLHGGLLNDLLVHARLLFFLALLTTRSTSLTMRRVRARAVRASLLLGLLGLLLLLLGLLFVILFLLLFLRLLLFLLLLAVDLVATSLDLAAALPAEAWAA